MFRNDLSRVYELKDLMENPEADGSFFRDFARSLKDQPPKLAAFLDLERCFNILDGNSWEIMKEEVKPYLNIKHENRGWQQLFDLINHIYAYSHLKDAGCTDISFIPRSEKHGVKSPDIKAIYNNVLLLCEVKTINISDEEAISRNTITAKHIRPHLKAGLFSKLDSDIKRAIQQLTSHDLDNKAMHMIYINVCFDDWVGDYAEEHMDEIKKHLEENEQRD